VVRLIGNEIPTPSSIRYSGFPEANCSMPNRAVAFVACHNFNQRGLAALITDMERFNRSVSVTGVALHDGCRVLSYIEGPPAALGAAFARAVGAFGHSDVIELAHGWVGPRRFPYWAMRCTPVTKGELLRIVRADWDGFAQKVGTTRPGTGMELLAALIR